MTYDTRARADLTVAELSTFWRPNIIINPEFTVNQRGAASSTTTSGAYNYDRWYYDGSSLLQGVENANIRDGVYTISWAGSANCSYSLNTATSSNQGAETYTSVSNGGNITISGLTTENLWIKFDAQPTWVKLELGSSTSAFIPRSVGDELMLCYRYCVNLDGKSNPYQPLGFAVLYSSTAGTATLYVPTQMRAIPSLTTTGQLNLSFDTATHIVSGFGGPYSQIGSVLDIDVNLSSATTSGKAGLIRWNNVAVNSRSFILSAEL